MRFGLATHETLWGGHRAPADSADDYRYSQRGGGGGNKCDLYLELSRVHRGD